MSEIQQFYSGKTLLITGATGFMGKVLVEKLLRSCADVAKIYLLLRCKADKSVAERLRDLLDTQIFDSIREAAVSNGDSSNQLAKLVPIRGDIMLPGLGLSSDDLSLLEQQVNIIFHAAATVKFDEELSISMDMNVRGTSELLKIAKRIHNLQAFVHVSTAYCNCDQQTIEERIYPMHVDVEQVMSAVQWLQDDVVALITPKLLKDRPNTYTYTKALAETMLDAQKGDLPVTIVRPAIVTCAWREPLPGWVDNYNGATGIIAAGGQGLLSTMLCDERRRVDLVPVDVAINVMIAAAWHVARQRPAEIPVVHCVSIGRTEGVDGAVNLRWGDVRRWILTEARSQPFSTAVAYPDCRLTRRPLVNKLRLLLGHMVPAYAADMLRLLVSTSSRGKFRMSRIYWKMTRAMSCLEYFTTNEWNIDNGNMVKLFFNMSSQDRTIFNFDMRNMDWQEYMRIYYDGVRRYIFAESDDSVSKRQARSRIIRLYYLQASLKWIARVLVCWLLWRRVPMARALISAISTLLATLWRCGLLLATCVSSKTPLSSSVLAV